MFYRTEDGQGTIHIRFGRKKDAVPACEAQRLDTDNPQVGTFCSRPSVARCDGTFPWGSRCDKPVCRHHVTTVGPTVDYCPDHQHLAPPTLLDSQVVEHALHDLRDDMRALDAMGRLGARRPKPRRVIDRQPDLPLTNEQFEKGIADLRRKLRGDS